jgi:L-ribulose-5-phosphate 4-epimerase
METGGVMDQILDIKFKIIKACRWLEEKELVIGTWGNISVKLKDSILLTPSRINYNVIVPEDIVTINFNGEKIGGNRIPTSEKEIHRLIHINREDVGAVVHNHSLYATAISCRGEGIPPILEEISQAIGGEIQCTGTYIPAGHHFELAEETVKYLKDKNAVLIRNHGVICCGRDLDEALINCLIVEKAAKMLLHAGLKDIITIPDKFVKEERDRFLYKYGKEEL